MAGELWFYHLERRSLEEALPELLEKVLERGWRAFVRVGTEERARRLDTHLWTYRDDAFLPHGLSGEGEEARQPILIGVETGPPVNAPPADDAGKAVRKTDTGIVLIVADRAAFPELSDPAALAAFERVMILFDGTDQEALTDARGYWKAAKAADLSAVYYAQNPRGKWEKKG